MTVSKSRPSLNIPTHADETPPATRPRKPEHNPYAITLAALVASAQVALTDQVQVQPAAPAHDYSSGFDTTGNDGDRSGRRSGLLTSGPTGFGNFA